MYPRSLKSSCNFKKDFKMYFDEHIERTDEKLSDGVYVCGSSL